MPDEASFPRMGFWKRDRISLDKWDYLRPWHRQWWTEVAIATRGIAGETVEGLRIIVSREPIPWHKRAGKAIEVILVLIFGLGYVAVYVGLPVALVAWIIRRLT